MKMPASFFGFLSFVRAFELFDTSALLAQISLIHLIDEEDAIQVVNFVQNTTREESICSDGVRIAVNVLKLTGNGDRAMHVSSYSWE